MRLRAELCGDLSERHSSHQIDLGGRTRGHEAGGRRSFPQVGQRPYKRLALKNILPVMQRALTTVVYNHATLLVSRDSKFQHFEVEDCKKRVRAALPLSSLWRCSPAASSLQSRTTRPITPRPPGSATTAACCGTRCS